MADTFSSEQRSQIMARVKSQNTAPEIIVRRLLHSMGYRFRLHRKDLPGKPDIVLPRHHKLILVHGCFWHGHSGCRRANRPNNNAGYWNAKIDRNIERDARTEAALTAAGWQTLVLWECELKDQEQLRQRLQEFMA